MVIDKGLGHEDEEEPLGVSSDRGKVIDVVVVRVSNEAKVEEESMYSHPQHTTKFRMINKFNDLMYD